MTTAEVYLWGTGIGSISQENVYDIPVFSYDRAFLDSGIQVSPLMMPLSSREYSFPALNKESFHTLPGLLSDSLPDRFGNQIISRYLSSQGRSIDDLTAVERLLYTGSRGMGALEFVPAKGFIEKGDGSIDINELVKLASDVLTNRENVHIKENDETMAQILKIGTSAGGARAKAVIAWNKETGDIRSGQIEAGEGYQYYLLKFDDVENNKDREAAPDEKPYTRIEYAYHLMASDAGISMQPCELYRENGRYHFVTKRFDRLDGGGKLHMQSLGAMAHFDYNDPGASSYEQAASIMNRIGIGQNEIKELFRRMVFSIMAKNNDDHVKNISFLMDRSGKWSLAPAYDITYSYDPNSYWLSKHQMCVAGKREGFVRADIINAGKSMNISKNTAEDIICQVADAVEKWPQFARQAEVPEHRVLEIQKEIAIEEDAIVSRVRKRQIGYA